MGGARNVANRMRHSASIASKLYSSFSALRDGNEPTISSIISSYRAENTDVYGMIDAISKSNFMDLTAVALAVKQVELSGINKLVKGNLSFASPEDRRSYLGVVSRGINELKNFLEVYDIL